MIDIYMLLPSGAYEVWRDVESFDRVQGGVAIRTDTPGVPLDRDAPTGPPDLWAYPVWYTTDLTVARLLSQDAEFVQRDLGARREEQVPGVVKGKAGKLPKLPKRKKDQ